MELHMAREWDSGGALSEDSAGAGGSKGRGEELGEGCRLGNRELQCVGLGGHGRATARGISCFSVKDSSKWTTIVDLTGM